MMYGFNVIVLYIQIFYMLRSSCKSPSDHASILNFRQAFHSLSKLYIYICGREEQLGFYSGYVGGRV